MRILASFVFFSLIGDLLAAPTWTTMTSIHTRHARLSPSRRNILNLSSSDGGLHLNRSRPGIVPAAVAPNDKRDDHTPISLPKNLYGDFSGNLESLGHKGSKKEKPLPAVQELLRQDVTTSESPTPTKTSTRPDHLKNGDLHGLNRGRPGIVSAAFAPNSKRDDHTPISLPKDIYGEFFDDLESWGHKESKEEKPLSLVQEVLLQDVTTSGSTSESPTPTKTSRPDHLPHMGPGLELAPSASRSSKSIRASSSLRKLIAVVTVFGVIGLVILFCFLVNEPRILLWRCCKARNTSLLEPVRTKRKLVMTEKDRSAWTSKYLSPLSPRPKYLSPPSSSPNDMSPELSATSNGQRPSSLVQGGTLDISSDLQKSKWSMTTSDYGASPRTSASTTGGQRSIAPDSVQQIPPSVLVRAPRVYNPLASGSERDSDGSDYLCRYGHSRNQSAPVTLSIASSGSDWNVEGRSRSSSESSWKVPRVQWR